MSNDQQAKKADAKAATATQPEQPGEDDEALLAVRSLVRATRMLERSSSELNLAHYRVLSAIAAGEQRASRMAARLALGKPAISAAVESLRARGLVSSSASAADQRVVTLGVTPAGVELLARVEAEMVARLEAIAHHAPDPGAVLHSLAALGAAIEEARNAHDHEHPPDPTHAHDHEHSPDHDQGSTGSPARTQA